MRILLLGLLLCCSAAADNWPQNMSPRMREKFAPLLRHDWDPRREVELTPKEKQELEELLQPLVQQLRRRPVLLEPAPAPGSEAQRRPDRSLLE
jgi:hypothetical protein